MKELFFVRNKNYFDTRGSIGIKFLILDGMIS